MKNNISSGILTPKLTNRITLLPKNKAKKKNKLQANNKYRNKSSDLFSVNMNDLPDINIKERKWPEDKNDNKMFKSSFASTFYSTNSNNQNFFSEKPKEKISRTSNLLNYKNFSVFKTKSTSKHRKKLEINPNYFDFKKLRKNKNDENINLYIDDNNDNLNNKENDY